MNKSTTTFEGTDTYTVGDKVNYSLGTDVFPATVVEVGPRKVVVQRDTFHVDPTWKPEFLPGGFHGHTANNREQRQIVERDTDGELITFTLKFPPKKVRDHNNIGKNERGVYTLQSPLSGYRGPRLRHGWKAFHDYNF